MTNLRMKIILSKTDQKRCKNTIEHVGIKTESTSHCSLPLVWSFPPTASSESIPGWDTFFPPTVFLINFPPLPPPPTGLEDKQPPGHGLMILTNNAKNLTTYLIFINSYTLSV